MYCIILNFEGELAYEKRERETSSSSADEKYIIYVMGVVCVFFINFRNEAEHAVGHNRIFVL